MSGRPLIWILAVCSACASSETRDGMERSGRLTLERTSPAPVRLADLQAVASYCARDSTLSVVASSRDWTAAIAVRATWPADTTRTFGVDSISGGAGRAAVAARSLRDSIQSALIGRSGEVTLDGGRTLAGRFAVGVLSDSASIALGGRFEGLHVREACP